VTTRHEVHLPEGTAGRLDRAVADAMDVGRAVVKRAFLQGRVRVDGRRARASDPALPGQVVQLEMEAPAGAPVPDSGDPLRVLAGSHRWIVADKPAGVATHPLRDGERGTLANAVAAEYPECADASLDPREGGAVHRLDADTSGCVLFARDREAWEELRRQLTARTVEKVYLALVAGRVSSGGVCSVPLSQRAGRSVPVPDQRPGDRLPARAGAPRPAETRWEIAHAFPHHTLLEVRIPTGAMHQIRAHMAYLGHPVAGDVDYGGAASALPGLERHFLHAWKLGFDRPEGGRVEVQSPLPAELAAALERLGADADPA
jgi:23S rRNA pseudouridine1911/1915/1917 synthase